MATSKETKTRYKAMYWNDRHLYVDFNKKSYDKSGMPAYPMMCPVCLTDRGILRLQSACLPCKKCGQKGKKSPLKGGQRDASFSIKISEGNRKFRQKTDKDWKPMSKECKKIAHSIRTRIWQGIKNTSNTSSSELTGLSWHDLKNYLQSKFQPGMTWDNYAKNGWHIDHIKPLSKFDLTDEDEQRRAYHYTNLQPLWAKDNIRKSDKYEER